MAKIILFPGGQANDINRYKWTNIPLGLQAHYNYLLNKVLEFDKEIIKPPSVTTVIPNYYNQGYCLTLTECLNASGATTSTPSLARTIPRTPCSIDADDATKYLVLPGFRYVREFNGGNP